MEPRESILNTIKNLLGVTPDFTAFDLQIITYINAAFADLTDLGLEIFEISDESSKWEDIPSIPIDQMNRVKTFIALKAQLLFDPPPTSFAIAAKEKQIEEHKWRINVNREATEWVPGGS